MFEKLKANILFNQILKRPDINKAYAMVPPSDSWYDTITTVHNSLAEMQKLPHENWTITSHDGLRLQGIYYPGTSDVTVIWVYGYTSHAERESAFPGLFYHSLGYNVLVPYLRAHGPSEGKYISFGALEHKDVLKWMEKVNALHPEGSIVVHGLSMGGGIALDLAAYRLKHLKCIIADAPNTSIEMFLRGITSHVFKQDAEKILPHVYDRYRKEFFVNPLDFDRVETIRTGNYPLLLSAGSEEHLEEALDRLAQNNPQPTEVVILPGCNHGNGMYKQTEMYQNAIKAFIKKYIAL